MEHNLEPKILYTHDDFFVLDKPQGWLTHEDGKTDAPAVTAWLVSRFPEISEVGETQVVTTSEGEKVITRPGIVHRLDRDTSGVLIVARNQKAHGEIKKQFMERLVEKTYAAFVYGFVQEDIGEVDAPIGRSAADYKKMTSHGKMRGMRRPAKTGYKVISRFVNSKVNFSFMELYPKTGRTHQIRVHAKQLGNPVVADRLYGGKLVRGKRPKLGFKRHALHARKIAFDFFGESFEVEADLPLDFQRVLDLVKKENEQK